MHRPEDISAESAEQRHEREAFNGLRGSRIGLLRSIAHLYELGNGLEDALLQLRVAFVRVATEYLPRFAPGIDVDEHGVVNRHRGFRLRLDDIRVEADVDLAHAHAGAQIRSTSREIGTAGRHWLCRVRSHGLFTDGRRRRRSGTAAEVRNISPPALGR